MNGIQAVKDKIGRGEVVIGSHVTMDNSFITELIAGVGFDFIWIDGEHGAMDLVEIQHHLMACRAAGAAGFVRIPWNEIYFAKQVLDMGADALVFPMINTVEEARRAVSYCTYPPRGVRGFGQRRVNNYNMDDKARYLREADQRCWTILQMEHIESYHNLEAILEVEGVDSIIIGANDFACSLGFIGNPYGQKETLEPLEKAAALIKKKGIPLGASIGYDPVALRHWMNWGVDWIGVGNELQFVSTLAMETLTKSAEIAKQAGRVFHKRTVK